MLPDRPSPQRFWELDALRGFAVLLMIFSNCVLDLQHLGMLEIEYAEGFWKWPGRVTAGLFITIAGASLTLSAARFSGPGPAPFSRYLRRGAKLCGIGMIITLATSVFAPQRPIVFGVLHLIGVGIVLAFPLLGLRWANLLLAACLVIPGAMIFARFRVDTPWLLWLGLRPEGFRSLDYTPLVPWFGVILIGVFLGQRIYPDGNRIWRLSTHPGSPALRLLSKAGEHSLLIYLLHQPVLLALLYCLRTAAA